MEENNKKKNKRIFYLMLGVSILLISGITGAFAYFSASKTSPEGSITGDTNNINNDTLTLNVEKIVFTGATANTNLVPAYFGKTNDTLNVPTPASLTQANVISMISNKCETDGYTGCHVYKIRFSSTQTISEANLLLNLTVTGATDKSQWGYALFTETGNVTNHETTGLALLTGNGVPGSIGSGVTNLDIHNGGGLTANSEQVYYLLVYVNDNDTVQNTAGDNYVVGSYNGSVTLQAMGGEVRAEFVKNAAEYITKLYTDATKSTATVNNVTYNLAPSVGLMNDRLASMSTDINGGNIRYYGANTNNYAWLGDTYSESYTIGSGATAINVVAGTKKLWRIIGVFNGKLKLISADPISAQGLSWDTSDNNDNYGYGYHYWEQADLMKLLNPGFESESINNSLYWNKTSGTVYTGQSNKTRNVSFLSSGLTENERNLIDSEIWYIGGFAETLSYVDVLYNGERRQSWNGKVGLVYPSDYGYAADLSQCSQTLNNYNNSSCYDSDWLYTGLNHWTITRCTKWAGSDTNSEVNAIQSSGYVSARRSSAYDAYLVNPVVHLKSDVVFSRGNGSKDEPFVIN